MSNVDGKQVTCMHTGLFSDLSDCGFKADWYSYVFVGSIGSIQSSADGEKQLQLIPEEVFHGIPPTYVDVVTSQGACLPKFVVGGRWLFYLHKQPGKPIVLDYYGNDSRPVELAQGEIETLRRLKTIGNYGILRGKVSSTQFEDKGVADARIVASRRSGGLRFSVVTAADGRYEFQPLPPGDYEIKMDPVRGFQADDSQVDVHRGGCWDLTLNRAPHAELDGRVMHSDRSPAANVDVLIATPEDGNNSWWITLKTDSRGRFHWDGLTAGRYVLGARLPGTSLWKVTNGAGGQPPTAPYYYPGVRDRGSAMPLTLSTDEKRNGIELLLPN